jgi:hypothetical protein
MVISLFRSLSVTDVFILGERSVDYNDVLSHLARKLPNIILQSRSFNTSLKSG